MSLFSLLLTINQVFAVGFESGDRFKAVPLSGQLSVYCPPSQDPAEPSHAFYTCRDLVLEPKSYDYFLGPQGLPADEVVLNCTRDDGSVRSKRVEYDGQRFRSRESINLWISTLFQRPLFKEGRNKISYTLVRNQSTVGQGQFEILVELAPARQCPKSIYHSANSQDCRSQFSVCNRYFSQYNNCTIH